MGKQTAQLRSKNLHPVRNIMENRHLRRARLLTGRREIRQSYFRGVK